jgi:hypothetical protein
MIQVLLIVLGSVLALMTGVAAEFIKYRISEARNKRLLKSLLRDEIPGIIMAIEGLVNETPTFRYIPLTRVAEIDNTRIGFDRNRDWLILFREESFRRDLFRFYLNLNSACQEARAVESLVSLPQFQEPQGQTFIREGRDRVLNRFRDLVNLGRNLLGRIDGQ